jgi:hypothetical protein
MSTSPFLTAREAALHLRFEHADGTANTNAFYQWRHRSPDLLPAYKRGRVLLFRKVDVELAVTKQGEELNAFLRRVR